MPSHLGVFGLSHLKRIMKKLVHEINGFYPNKMCYQDTDSPHIHMDHYQRLKKAGFVGNILGQGKNDNGQGGAFHGKFHAAKMKMSYTTDKYGVLDENKTFKGYSDTERLLETIKISNRKLLKLLVENFLFHG